MGFAESVKNVAVAMVIGLCLMMPGVSAATLAVVFGIYDRLIRDLSKPTKYLREDGWFVLTIIVVAIFGVYVCARGLNFLISEHEVPLMIFFAVSV